MTEAQLREAHDWWLEQRRLYGLPTGDNDWKEYLERLDSVIHSRQPSAAVTSHEMAEWLHTLSS